MTNIWAFYTAIELGPDKNSANGRLLATASRLPNGECPPEISNLLESWRGRHRMELRRADQAAFAGKSRHIAPKLRRNFPLLANELFERELAARPDFFAGKRG
jgi:hypothetical protein